MKKRTSSLLFGCALLFDQLTKALAAHFLASGATYSFPCNLITLTYIENHDGFLGVLSSLPDTLTHFLLTWGVAAFLIFSFWLLPRISFLTGNKMAAAVLVLAGACGNLLDRLFHQGGVIDFILVCLGHLCTGIFNIADMYILVGCFYLGFRFAESSR